MGTSEQSAMPLWSHCCFYTFGVKKKLSMLAADSTPFLLDLFCLLGGPAYLELASKSSYEPVIASLTQL